MSLGFSTDKGIEKQLSKMMKQFEHNKFILEDFGLMKPSKGGSHIWNRHCLDLNNGSVIDGFSVEGKKRGARPHLFILDDPEYYDDGSESRSSVLHEQFNKVLFKEIIPMLRPGCSLAWIGTVINMRSFINHACTSDDKRFRRWNRKVYTALDENKNSIWSEMWNDEALENRREEIGDAAFSSEYLNTPCSDQDRLLAIKPELNEYKVEGYEPDLYSDKRTEIVVGDKGDVSYSIRNVDKDIVECREDFSHLTRRMYRILTFDYAEGLRAHNDFSCIAITGYTSDNCMWVLDMWLGRAKRPQLIKMIYQYAYKWQVKYIGIEAVGMQKELVESVDDYLGESLSESVIFKPPVIPITYGRNHSKQNRIASLQWRFTKGKIKYPSHLRNTFAISNLYDQTNDFTMDLAFLRHDDAIDTVGMSQYMLKNRGVKTDDTVPMMSAIDKLSSGRHTELGVNLASSIDLNTLTEEELGRIIAGNITNTNKNRLSRPRAIGGGNRSRMRLRR